VARHTHLWDGGGARRNRARYPRWRLFPPVRPDARPVSVPESAGDRDGNSWNVPAGTLPGAVSDGRRIHRERQRRAGRMEPRLAHNPDRPSDGGVLALAAALPRLRSGAISMRPCSESVISPRRWRNTVIK
jgi:hypothetical protein